MASKLIAVIHYLDDDTSMRNADIAFGSGYEGVCLIHMQGKDHLIDSALVKIKIRYPERLVISNRLSMAPSEMVLYDSELGIDGSWADNPLEDCTGKLARNLDFVRKFNPGFLFFGSVAFKTQRFDPDPGSSAVAAHRKGWIATTSGPQTGVAPDARKLEIMRKSLGEAPFAVASGIAPENADDLCRYVDWVFVSTGISRNFYEFDEKKTRELREKTL